MSIRIRPEGQIATEVSLSLADLEELVAAAQAEDLLLSIDPYHDEGFRYFLHSAGTHSLVLRSNDISHVSHWLGLPAPTHESGILPADLGPTEYVVDNKLHKGPIGILPRLGLAAHPAAPLPSPGSGPGRDAALVRRKALQLKSGYGNLDCLKALALSNGNAEAALALLIQTNGFARNKV